MQNVGLESTGHIIILYISYLRYVSSFICSADIVGDYNVQIWFLYLNIFPYCLELIKSFRLLTPFLLNAAKDSLFILDQEYLLYLQFECYLNCKLINAEK